MKSNDTLISDGNQRQLAAGMLKQVAEDLQRFHNATTPIERELYWDAYSWVMSNDYSWPFSFPNVCRLLNRCPEDLRQEVLGDLSFGTLGRWVRRCQRAARRLSGSLDRRFAAERPENTALPVSVMETSY